VIRHFLNPPNWFTAASIFCSVYGLTLLVGHEATPDRIVKACILVIFGGIFDMMDGRVARMTNRFTEFGVQLDSLADMISFGVAPALIAWAWALSDLGRAGAVVAVWFPIAAAFRLARFNVNAAGNDWPHKGHSQGLTSTMAGGVLVTFAWLSNDYLAGVLKPPPWFVAVVVVLLGLGMVSSIPWRSFRDVRQNKLSRRILQATLVVCSVGAIALHPSMWFGIGALLYATVGVVDGLATWAHHRRNGHAMLAAVDADDSPSEP